jgi:hypothetical protein
LWIVLGDMALCAYVYCAFCCASPAVPTSVCACANAQEDGGVRYQWIVRARPDMYWYDAHPALCGSVDRIVQHKFPHAQWFEGGEFDDQYFVMPRTHADAVFGGMARNCTHCTRPLDDGAAWSRA